MHTTPAALVSLLVALAQAQALRSHNIYNLPRAEDAAAAPASAPAPAATVAATATAGTTVNAACAQANVLAQGVALNIADQQQELTTVNNIATILQAPTVDMAAFMGAKTDLLRFVNNGIAIRQMNQQITPAGNMATAGLAVVATAQLDELSLSTSLTGVPATDAPTVAALQKNFADGIQKNMENMAMAAAGCTAAVTAAGANQPAAAAAAAANNGTVGARPRVKVRHIFQS